MVKTATEKQGKLLRYIVSFTAEHGFQPCVKDMCGEMEVNSTNAIHTHLRALDKKGYIELSKGQPRAIRILRR